MTLTKSVKIEINTTVQEDISNVTTQSWGFICTHYPVCYCVYIIKFTDCQSAVRCIRLSAGQCFTGTQVWRCPSIYIYIYIYRRYIYIYIRPESMRRLPRFATKVGQIGPKWKKNPGLFPIRISDWNLIFKITVFVPFETNLTYFRPKSETPKPQPHNDTRENPGMLDLA